MQNETSFGTSLDDVTFVAPVGKISGIAGVSGNGWAKLLAALSGFRFQLRLSGLRTEDREGLPRYRAPARNRLQESRELQHLRCGARPAAIFPA
jgi:ABC-type uncharacterized transport system ATPase subunit